MKIRSNARHYMGIALSVGLAATAGCQAPQPTAPDETQLRQALGQPQTAAAQTAADLGLTKQPIQTEEFKLIAGGKPLTKAVVVVGDQFMVPDERGVIRLPKSEALADGKTVISVQAEGFVPASLPVVGGAAMDLTPLDPSRTQISAANGGIARNSDGTMEVSFAPGSLSKDANVSVTRIFTEQHNAFYAPKPEADARRQSLGQYSYHLDMGDADLTSTAGVIVRFKVEGALKAHFAEEMAAPKGLEGSNIKDDFSQDTQGNMWFAMKHDAPLPKPAEALAAGALSTFKLLAGGCQTFPSDQYMWITRNVLVSQTSGNCDNRGDGGVNFHDYRYNSGHCQYWRDSKYQCEGRTLVEYNTHYRPAPSSGVVATVTWSSNDSRISGPVSGIRVGFSHAGSDANTPTRPPKTQDWTDGTGQANGYGAQGANGTASAVPPDAWVYTSARSYNLNCSNVQLTLIKNKPNVRFVYTRRGTATPASITIPTSHSGVSVSSAGSPTAAITMHSTTAATEQFSAAGSWQPSGDVWIDAKSPSAHTIQWNNHNNGGSPTTVPTNIWFSKQIGATLTYLSNDDSAPADQRPVQQWNNKPAKADVAFSHEVSAYAGKPGGRDTLTFSQAAGSAGTWGINGESGSVTATVNGPDTPTPVSLTGRATYQIAGNTVGVRVNANLPEMNITIREMETDDTAFKLIYLLDGAEKEMRISRSGSTLRFSIPVEDQLNAPRKHTFKIKWFGTENGNTTFWMANRAAFPTLTVARAGVYDHPALDGTLNAAK